MNIASFSIKRPILITSLVLLLLITGLISLNRLGVDLFPDVNFPLVAVTTVYPGSAPEEIENLISKPLEDELISVTGLKNLTSRNLEGMSIVLVEFTLETDIKDAEQQVRDRVALVRPELPDGIEEPTIERFDPTDVPVARIAVSGNLPPTEMYDLAREEVKASIEQVSGVGSVEIIGGSRREIQVEIDRDKMNYFEISALSIADKIKNAGTNVPIGKFESGKSETVFRSVARFETLDQIKNVSVAFTGDYAYGVQLSQVANVIDGIKDRTSLGFLYAPVPGKKRPDGGQVREQRPALLLDIFKQSGANSVAVSDGVREKVSRMNEQLKSRPGDARLGFVYDGARWIRINIRDVFETIVIGIILAVIVVYLFLGNVRSTIITGIALPNSLLGAFILMYIMGFTVNVMTLLALSLTVGLLIDDAIVVRENIFRRLEEGLHPVEAAEKGTMQVALAVIATTLTIVAVFFPIGFMSGIVGQFFKQFGLTVVFAMIVSLADALTVAPFLSAYFAGRAHEKKNALIRVFDRFQDLLEKYYLKLINVSIRRPLFIIGITTIVFFASLFSVAFIKVTFFPESEEGEFMVNIELRPGTSLDGTREVLARIEDRIKTIPEVDLMATVVGGREGESNNGTIGVSLVPYEKRVRKTPQVIEQVRGMLKDFAFAKPRIGEYDTTGGGSYPFMMNIRCNDLKVLEEYSARLMDRMKTIPDLTEIQSSMQEGRPEFQVKLDPRKMQMAGVSPNIVGAELRYHIAGEVVGQLHERGLEYDVRLRLRPEQRNLKSAYYQTKVPNSMGQGERLIRLSSISVPFEETGASYILRENRTRAVQVTANTAPGGGIGNAIAAIDKIIREEMPMPQGMSYAYVGATEGFGEMMTNIMIAFVLAMIFIYLVLSSLYESFITPFTILMAIPPALSGAFIALLITGKMFDMMSMIGIIMLLGLVTKNSILLVDFIVTGIRRGMTREDAIREAGRVRLRPILMTTFAMIAGTLPVALGIGEAASFRVSMGVAVVGGLVVSTFITLFVVPAVFGYVDRFREFVEKPFRPVYDAVSPSAAERQPEGAEAERVMEGAITGATGKAVPVKDEKRRKKRG